MVVVVDVVVVEVEVVFGPISVSGFVDRVAVMGTDLGDNLKLTIPRFHFYYRKRLLDQISLTSVVVVVVVVQTPHVYGQNFSVFGITPHIDARFSQLGDPSMHACPDACGLGLRHTKIESLEINIMT